MIVHYNKADGHECAPNRKRGRAVSETKLKAERRKKGLTQVQVAEQAKVSIRAYIQYEAGERIPRADTAKLIAKALDSTVEDLF